MKAIQTAVSKNDFIGHSYFPFRANSYVRWYPKSLNTNFDLFTLSNHSLAPKGVYIHVPFCDTICKFCPFNKVPSRPFLVEQFVNALRKEIELYARLLSFNNVGFVYFGGGTPTVLSIKDFSSILKSLRVAGVDINSCEVAIEAHPKHLKHESIQEWKNLGINRVSSGIQAFTDRELNALGSHHTQLDVDIGLISLSKVFPNYAIDLIYRFNDQSIHDWEKTLNRVIADQIPHISAYALVSADLPTSSERLLEAEMATLLDSKLLEAGYLHYASCASGGYDYCLLGKEGLYEKSHWSAPQASYIGLGPGAFGFVGNATTVNGLGIEAYCQSVSQEHLPLASVEYADIEEQKHRFFVLGVKTLKVSLIEYRNQFNENISPHFKSVIKSLEQSGLVKVANDWLYVTSLGRHFVDEISTAFFSTAQAKVVHPEEPEIRRAELARITLLQNK